MKKLFAMLLALCMVVASLAACGNTEQTTDTTIKDTTATAETQAADTTAETEAAETEWTEDPTAVTWMLWNVGGTLNEAGLQAVEDAVNEITLKKINVQVDLQILEMGTYLSQMPMQVSAGDKIDLITTFPAAAGSFVNMVNAGQLMPLNDLLEEYAAETLELMPSTLFEATTVDGNIYGVPVYTDNTNDLHIIFRKAYLDEIGVATEDIKTIDDVTAAYEKIYALHPDKKMFSSGTQTVWGPGSLAFTATNKTYDALGTTLLGVMADDPTKVVSLFETEDYKKEMEVVKDWYAKGYIDQDIMIRQDDPITDDTVISFYLSGNAQRTAGNEALAGEALASVKLVKCNVGTSTVAMLSMAIPVCATEPEAAMELLNLCYTDKDLKQLVSHGIEGVNYTYAENGGLVQDTESSYAPNTAGIFGNAMLCDQTDQEVALGYNKADVDQSVLPYSPLLGFILNTDAISNEAAALDAVYQEYKAMLCCGMADDATYQKFIDKLYANGFQKYIDEVQHQVDEFLATK